MNLLLVASAGGHLQQLVWLAPWWRRHDRSWITFDTPDARAMLAGERIAFAASPTNRSVRNLARNLLLARRILADEAPDLVVTTGAGVAVPVFVAARARGIPRVFVEVYDRVDGPSLTGRLCAPLADRVVVQRREQLAFYRGAALLGPVR
ncbi:MAG: UDP-N-acetylglucosamine--LPS N-acetylglucosamine transferase [Myxococcota bacterium]